MIRAVLFDIYGTLLESAAGDRPPATGRLPERSEGESAELLERLQRAIAVRHAASPFPYPEVDIVEIWAELLPDLPPQEAATYALAAEEALTPLTAMPGAREVLHALAGRRLPLGLLSNAQRHTPVLLERHLGEAAGCFDPRLCRFSWREERAKPDPWLFESLRETLAGLGIAAAETLYVGNDVAKDILPARACGFRTALHLGSGALRWRGRNRHDCGADWLLGDLRELLLPPNGRHELRYFP